MKIWEIEDGREFSVAIFKTRYKKEQGKLYFWNRYDEEWTESELSYNDAANLDSEYLPEKKYYLKAKEELKCSNCAEYLNYDVYAKVYSLNNESDSVLYTTQFTEEEIKQIPQLWLTICDKVEVESD